MGQSFKDLVVWQKAIELTEAVYRFTAKFPDAERFGLTNQMRRASVSAASNITEGYGRVTKGEYFNSWATRAVHAANSTRNSALQRGFSSALLKAAK